MLYGWRPSTVDIDVRIEPDRDDILREIPSIKERLSVNVELASPADFIPVRDDWQERSRFIVQTGRIAFCHFDFYAQALSKIERGHRRDLEDVAATLDRGFIEPAIDPASFRRAVEEATRK